MYFNKHKQNSPIDKRLSYLIRVSSAVFISAIISGCAINSPFIPDSNKHTTGVEHKTEPEYAYKIFYNTNDQINSYSANFKYCNPFNIVGAKSTLNYELDVKFKNNLFGRLLLPFEIKKNKSVKLYFSKINIVAHTDNYYEINIPHIKNNDRLEERVIANGTETKIDINDVTLGWARNYSLNSLLYKKITCPEHLDKLRTGMQMILYLYKYPSTLSLNSNITCILDKSNRYKMQLSIDKVDNGNLIDIISSNYKQNPIKCDYFFGNYMLSLENNGFSLLKLARRKAF